MLHKNKLPGKYGEDSNDVGPYRPMYRSDPGEEIKVEVEVEDDVEQKQSQVLEEQASSDEADQKGNDTKKRLFRNPLYLGFISNVIFFLGAVAFVRFTSLEFEGRAEAEGAAINGVYATSFICFLFNGAIELFIDLWVIRTEKHGRYSSKTSLNLAVSVLFVVGTALDVAGFVLWNKDKFVPEHRLLYASAHLWLFAAVLVFAGTATEISSKKDVLDGFGNLLFFAGSLTDCIARYLDLPSAPLAPRNVARLEKSSSVMFLANSICFVLTDVLRVAHQRRKEKTLSQR